MDWTNQEIDMPRPHRALALAALVALTSLARPGGSQPASLSSAGEASGSDQAAPARSGAGRTPTAPATALDVEEARAFLKNLAADVRHWGGRLGAMAVDVASGAPLLAVDEHGLYNPASNAKLFTAAAALRALGPSHRYLTGLYGTIDGDVVPELVLRGDGDPSLETRDLWEMARELRAAGVRKVGALAIDQGYFDDQYVPPAFDQQPHEWAAFRAPVAAVSLNANTVTFTVRAVKSGQPAAISVEPPGLVDVRGRVTTSSEDAPEELLLELEARGDRLVAHLGGSVPEGSRLVRAARRVDDPRLLAAYALRAILEGVGIQVTGDLRLGGARQKRLLVAHRSASLGVLLHPVGKDSDNFYAEMVFKTIAAKKKGSPGTAAAAAEIVAGAVEALGALEHGIVVRNGSGLFDANRASPWSIARLLRAAFLDPALSADFTAQLAIGGVDGTLRSRFRAWAGRRAIRAKTGTLDGVSTLSGYILGPAGRPPIAFSILINDVPGKMNAARRGMDRVVDALARARWSGAG
jgi:D-alanyl-D-alanine carboxypeptidase/D-alanyl-D-alanine-endopeptidase (penicillin-binding protein 4)